MVPSTRAASGIATRAEGSFASCGFGRGAFELSYSCQGPACSGLDGSFLDIACHRDGNSRLICSNDFRCQPGTTSYQSNFTFSQNEPDPWSPVMENKPDIWVPQKQDVLVASCARFSLVSDGSKEGTQVDDEGPVDSCPVASDISTANNNAEHSPTTTGRPYVAASQRPLIFAGMGSRRTASTASLILALTLTWFLILPETLAAAAQTRQDHFLETNGVQSRAASDRLKAFANGFRANIAARAETHGADGKAFANQLVADVVSSVCGSHFGGSKPISFTPDVLKICVSTVYSDGRLPQPGLHFLAVFGASLLCDYVVSEMYPDGQEFRSDGCEGLKDLMDETHTSGPMPAKPSSGAPSVSSDVFEASDTQYMLTSFSYQESFTSSLTGLPSSGEVSTVDASISVTPLTEAPPSGLLPSDATSTSPWMANLTLSTPTRQDFLSASASSPNSSTSGSIVPSSAVSIVIPASNSATAPQSLPTVLGPMESPFPPPPSSSTSSSFSSMQTPATNILSSSTEHTSHVPTDTAVDIGSMSGVPVQTISKLRTLQSSGLVDVIGLSEDHLSSGTDTSNVLHTGFASVTGLPTISISAGTSALVPQPTISQGAANPVQTTTQGSSGSQTNATSPLTSVGQPDFSVFDELDSTPYHAVSASITVTSPVNTSIEAILTTKTRTRSSFPSFSISPGPDLVDLDTESWGWSENPPTGSSQSVLLSTTSQPRNVSSTLSADPSYGKALFNTTGGSTLQSPYFSKNSTLVPASLTLTELGLKPNNLNFSTSMASTSSYSASSILSTGISRPPNHANSTRLATSAVMQSSRRTNKTTSSTNPITSISVMKPALSMASIDDPLAIDLVSMTSQLSDGVIQPSNVKVTTAETIVVTAIRTVTVHLAPSLTSINFASSTYSCSPISEGPNFCPGSGCVSLKNDKAHCGACDQVCEHNCHQGVCVCPDLTRPDRNNNCMNEPGSGSCLTGYARNKFRVCAPVRVTTLAESSTRASNQPSTNEVTVPSFAPPVSSGPSTVSATAFSTQSPELGYIYCPPAMPNICDGDCFNTETEHAHCGGCGNFCSGTCTKGRCLATPTPSREQLVVTGRTITITMVLTGSPLRTHVPSTTPLASYIWRGLAGF